VPSSDIGARRSAQPLGDSLRQLRSSKVVLPIIAVLSATPIPLAAGEQPAQIVTIRITDDVNCLVEDARVPCDKVVAHLRDVLKVPIRAQFRILPDKASPYEATAKLMEQLEKSGYKLKMGYVNVVEDPRN
jgi:biopolymer transport protein ExbD